MRLLQSNEMIRVAGGVITMTENSNGFELTLTDWFDKFEYDNVTFGYSSFYSRCKYHDYGILRCLFGNGSGYDFNVSSDKTNAGMHYTVEFNK